MVFSESSNTWRNLHLAGYKIVAIDLLGHGSSAKPKELALYKLEAILEKSALPLRNLLTEMPYFLAIQWADDWRFVIALLIRQLLLNI